MSETSKTIRVEKDGNIVVITIDRVSARNSFDLATAQQMEAALDSLDQDDSAFVGIVSGAGGFFCAGQDLKAAARGEGALTERRGGFGIMAKPSSKPLIAAVEGPALAGGFELALSCDLIVAARNATFGLPEVRRSLVALGGGILRLPRRIPYHLAMEMILLGDPVPAEAMKAHGVVNRISEPGEALATALALARAMAANGPLALKASKEIAFRAQSEAWTEEHGWREQMRIAGPVLASEDFKEGLAAFAEKRAPVWRGR
ncbi:MAG: crotonase/enoyl-CoA hydratase family protein [Rhizomicrobium sp.]